MHLVANEIVRARTDAVKACARELGFDACGIATAGDVDPQDRLGDWLSRGYHADMAWMAATHEMRRDIRLKLPGARSVVVVARNYYAPDPDAPFDGGRVARYARGRDYHRVLPKPLRRLRQFLDSLEPGAESYGCIDSGPVMEKAWAARSGLGWVGKNSLVLRRDLGSWFFLAVVATTVELEADEPTPDYCGTCTACIDACPTTAIVEPRVVDSRRCISYQTIENRGEIPKALSDAFQDWAFGCDICQDVCPWNRRPLVTTERDFHPRPGHASIDIESVQAMDDAAYLEAFAGTPLMRAKRAGLQRNLSIVQRNRTKGTLTA